MNDSQQISAREWELIVQLLNEEKDQLPSEIHHTDNAQTKKDLEERKQMVEDLLARVNSAAQV